VPSIAVEALLFDPDAWVRDAVDSGRVNLFTSQMQEGAAFPPIEVVPQTDGTFLIGDGVHRCLAVRRLGQVEIDAVIVIPEPNESPAECAYRIALETASRSALPLTRSERRRAAVHLLEFQPQLSRRAIAQLVGVAHSSVNRWAEEVSQSSAADESEVRMPVGMTPSRIASRLVGTLERLSESRGLLDYLAPKRMGRHLAEAFTDRFDHSAPDEARRFRSWLDQTVSILETDQ
jgi:ParB-like chromosome segregation protein Spo0J